jgi:hypothetical protein
MRKLLTAFLSAALATIVVLPTTATPAAADGAFDASVSIADFPDPVTVSTGTTVYKYTVRADGVLPVFPATLTISLTGAGKFNQAGTQAPGCTLPADGTPNPSTFTCAVSPTNGVDLVLYVAVQATAFGTLTSTASVMYDPPLADPILDMNPANDSDSESTTVSSSSTSNATYLKQGESATYQGHKMTVRQSATGVIEQMRNGAAAGASCGIAACKQALRVLFFETDRYSGKVGIDLYFGSTNPCQGQTAATCKPVYYRKSSTGPAIGMNKCVAATDTLCWESKTFDGCSWHVVVRMDSSDPDLLSPVRGLTSGSTS